MSIGRDRPPKTRRITVSKEFTMFSIAFAILISILVYSPYEIANVLKGLEKIAEQNQNIGKQNTEFSKQNVKLNEQTINSTNEIIHTINDYINSTDTKRTESGLDIIKVLFLYMEDLERDTGKIMKELNISNTHFVKANNTHVMTENGTFKLPYPINLTVAGNNGK